MSLLSVGLSFLVAASAVAGAPLERRAEIAHDAVVGFSQTVPDTTVGQLYLKYKPLLKVVNGCVPFPAVDADGNTSGGLAPTGSPSGDCDSSTGQVYVRSTSYNNAYAIMYSWYWPKDSPSTGTGHRHDWENVVVWIDSETAAEPTILGVSASAHSGYGTSTSPNLSGTRPLIKYESIWPVNHALGFTSTVGGEQPLIAWESLPTAAQTALTNTDFGSANVPFKDANFENNLGKAAL
ncbi:necrosis inducing protein [Phyllosticta citribraziliensis]|uniref:Necrosis inducing protein n=1 Tax=Phyllosticta citribraziliensis TaxID=989973 RepID=A0ABR1LP75_9PEZI